MSPMQVNHTLTQMRMDLERARAEIERLQKEWISLHGVERMRYAALHRQREQLTDTAAFLDGLAVKLDYLASEYADDCRERAKKLRGET